MLKVRIILPNLNLFGKYIKQSIHPIPQLLVLEMSKHQLQQFKMQKSSNPYRKRDLQFSINCSMGEVTQTRAEFGISASVRFTERVVEATLV